MIVLETNLVSNTGNTAYRWEPSAALADPSTFVHSWAEVLLSGSFASYVSAWNGSSWTQPFQLTAPNAQQQGDVNVAWDSYRGRFVFVTLDGPGGNVWYGYSSDATGTSWTFTPTPIFPGSPISPGAITWDYPSIGVDAGGRIIIGAVLFFTDPNTRITSPQEYAAALSTDGTNFSNPSYVASPPNGYGMRSRVVATDSLFEAFVPELDVQSNEFRPYAVERWESSDGVTWNGPLDTTTFGEPLNESPYPAPYIFYAPLLAATGSTNGLWAWAIQIDNGGFNNVFTCQSDRGCGIINSAADDQFLAGVSVSGDGGYWYGYVGYSSLNTRQLPLIAQAIYFPAGQPGIGATTNTGIDPTSWRPMPAGTRCTADCYAAGDFATVASNSYMGATTPLIIQDSFQTDLYQNFVADPPTTPNVPNFRPNFVAYPPGSNLTSLAVKGRRPVSGVAVLPGKTIGLTIH